MQKHLLRSLACVALLAGGCTAEQTQEGRAPDVDIDVDPGRWPDYDVQWADVDVGTSERTVTVPVVRVEQETREVSVPYIDVNPAGARNREERTITVAADAPSAGYSLRITEVRAAQDNLWVIADLMPPADGASAQMVTRVSDHVVINAPGELDVRTVIVGRRPDGMSNQQHRFVDSRDALDQLIPQGARTIYQRS